jgi:hypothetical protein
MESKITKTNDQKGHFIALLNEVRMNGHERLKAKARMAQAEAFADAVAELFHYAKRLLNALVLRPYHRLTASH